LNTRSMTFENVFQGFIDLVNNPAGVGHSHPLPVRAAAAQLARLNTNTRYVYPVQILKRILNTVTLYSK